MLDSLTGLPLPRVFIRDLEGHLSNATQPVAILIADFDHFRDVNGKHGVVLGDEVLQGLASLFCKCCAAMPDAVCYRYGGSVFDVILVVQDTQTAREFAELIRMEVEGFRHKDVGLTVSIGMATAPQDGSVAQELTDKAYAALHRAKKNGRNRVEVALRSNGPSRLR
jgi:two-component system cell cycle response regulator